MPHRSGEVLFGSSEGGWEQAAKKEGRIRLGVSVGCWRRVGRLQRVRIRPLSLVGLVVRLAAPPPHGLGLASSFRRGFAVPVPQGRGLQLLGGRPGGHALRFAGRIRVHLDHMLRLEVLAHVEAAEGAAPHGLPRLGHVEKALAHGFGGQLLLFVQLARLAKDCQKSLISRRQFDLSQPFLDIFRCRHRLDAICRFWYELAAGFLATV
mmetsp:Transcript_6998/g.15995  ORF Transcript_6998/g.15995 Transcript_6998/m.15995 type:complete len:208 (+) Transcript_6998:502-1125(+)